MTLQADFYYNNYYYLNEWYTGVLLSTSTLGDYKVTHRESGISFLESVSQSDVSVLIGIKEVKFADETLSTINDRFRPYSTSWEDSGRARHALPLGNIRLVWFSHQQ